MDTLLDTYFNVSTWIFYCFNLIFRCILHRFFLKSCSDAFIHIFWLVFNRYDTMEILYSFFLSIAPIEILLWNFRSSLIFLYLVLCLRICLSMENHESLSKHVPLLVKVYSFSLKRIFSSWGSAADVALRFLNVAVHLSPVKYYSIAKILLKINNPSFSDASASLAYTFCEVLWSIG